VTPSHRFFAFVALASLSACHVGARPAVEPAPAAPEAAVQAFLAAVDSNVIDRMAALWGTDRGPSTVVVRNATEREQRLVIMREVLQHDSYRFVPAPSAPNPRPGRHMLYVELRRGDSRATVPFTLVAQRDGGWLVENVGLDAVMPTASPRRPTPP
jgi:hypothetical protein